MDRISKERRSWNMSRIGGKNTRPEIIVRSVLHRLGYRFRLGTSDLPGHPDVVLPKYKIALFVHGCFWHRHPGCRFAYLPKTRMDFWQRKFAQTIVNDQKVKIDIEVLGWKPLTVWECETVDREKLKEMFETEMRQRK